MTRQQLFAAFFFAALLFLLFQFYVIFSVFLGPLSWAALLTIAFYPIHTRLVQLAGGRQTLVAFGFTTAVILVVMVPTILLIVVLAGESVVAYQRLQQILESGTAPAIAELLQRLHGTPIGRLWDLVAAQVDAWNINLRATALKFGDTVSSFVVAQAAGIAKNAVRFVVNFFLTTFALFFFFRDGERMVRSLRELIPMEPAHKAAVFERLGDTLSAVIQGTLATAAAQGFLAGLGFWVLGVPFAAGLGCATAFVSLLPGGAAFIWVGVVVYLLTIGAWVRGVIMLVWGALAVSGVDNVIRPLIIGGRTRIPTVFLFFGILGGLQAYGFLGIFLAPVVIAILVAFIRIYREIYATHAPATDGSGHPRNS